MVERVLGPRLPARSFQDRDHLVDLAGVQAIAVERQALTAGILEALCGLPVAERPILVSVSGADDLQPDATGTISHASRLRERPTGFARIGIPVRRLIEASGVDATFVYFGNLVYGPGKLFAEYYVKGLAAGKARVVGSGANRLPLTHVADAAGALVHLVGLPRQDIVGRTFVAMDGADTTQRALLDLTADAMGVKRTGSVPAWIARLVAGPVAVETITLDVHADPSALLATGFRFRYPSPREGVPAALGSLAITTTPATG